MSCYEVIKFSTENLCESLSNDRTEVNLISSKRHFIYFEEYLKELDTKSILVENKYLSRSYLSDYSFYYSKCFQDYSMFCKRVHFFSKPFTKNQFESKLLKNDLSLFDSYLGYIVIRPIPISTIGATLIKTYPNADSVNQRIFFGVRDYSINLFGVKLNLETLAFQEQDTFVSACATTALWSMLHKATKQFDLTIKNPSEITKEAGITSAAGGRMFPNKGLTTKQMCDVIFNSGLVTEIRHIDTEFEGKTGISSLKQLIKAYSKLGIPIIMNLKVPTSDTDNLTDFDSHAVTICGYKQKDDNNKKEPNDDITLIADEMEKIYAHDDQWGPFSRVVFNEDHLSTSWNEFDMYGRFQTHSTELLIPVYPSIKISYEDIFSIVLSIDAILRLAFEDNLVEDFNWDIELAFSNEFKESIRKSSLPRKDKLRILQTCYPKYIWSSSCYINEVKIFEYIFDATALSTSMYGIEAIGFEKRTKNHITNFLELNGDLCGYFDHQNCVDFIDFISLTN